MRYLRMTLMLGMLLAAFALVACSPSENESADGGDTSAETSDSNSLVIYSGRSESLVQPIIDQFEAETGIEVDVRYGSTAEMAGVLLEEGANSPADLFYAQDPGGLGAVQAAGLLAALPAETLENVPARFASETDDWVGVSGRARTVVYNTDAISDPSAELPADIFDFTAPEWQGRIGWAPSNGSFQAMVTAMRATWGDEKTREWLSGIQANNPIVYPSNTPTVSGVANGEVDVGFVNHYYLFRFLSEEGESFPARNYFLPGGGPGSLIMVSGAGILDSAENAANAQAFINFLLSETGQEYFATETFEYPVVEGIAIPELLVPLSELDAQAVEIDLADMADLQGTQDMLLELGIIE